MRTISGSARARSGWLLLVFVLALVGCGAGTEGATTPTAVALPVVESGATPTAATVPPTWTPLPDGVNLPMIAGNGGGNLPDRTPTPAQIIPTNTAVPPTATPTISATVTITATATRYVSFIPDLPPTNELGPSKLGLHVNRPNSPAIMAFVREAQPAVMKGVADLGWLADVRRESPRTIIIGRIPVERQEYQGEPEEEARKMVAAQLEEYQNNPWVDYWEGWNEPDPNMERMEWYARFEAERVRQLAQHGLKAAIGGFPAGVPEIDEFALFVPAIRVAKEHRGILTLHEYAAPDITYLFGDPLPGGIAYPDRGSLMFRYRHYYRDILEPNDLVIPLVISEAGIDGIIGGRPGPAGQGWRDFQDFWVEQGWGVSGPEAFIRQLNWYDNGVRTDGYVIGFTVFTAGGAQRWETYDLNPILPELAAYVRGQG